jgi:hypothetical protein
MVIDSQYKEQMYSVEILKIRVWYMTACVANNTDMRELYRLLKDNKQKIKDAIKQFLDELATLKTNT